MAHDPADAVVRLIQPGSKGAWLIRMSCTFLPRWRPRWPKVAAKRVQHIVAGPAVRLVGPAMAGCARPRPAGAERGRVGALRLSSPKRLLSARRVAPSMLFCCLCQTGRRAPGASGRTTPARQKITGMARACGARKIGHRDSHGQTGQGGAGTCTMYSCLSPSVILCRLSAAYAYRCRELC